MRCSENPDGEAFEMSENVSPVPLPRWSKGKGKDKDGDAEDAVYEDNLGVDFTPAAPSSSQDYMNDVPKFAPAGRDVRAASAMDFTRAGAATPALSARSCPPPSYNGGYPKVTGDGGAEDFTTDDPTQT